MWQDVKLALRMIRSRPGFALVVLVTLALGIGANTAIFSVVDSIVLRPLPYRDPQRLFSIVPTNPKDGGKDRLARLAEVEVLRGQLRSFSDLAVATRVWESLVTTDDGESASIKGISASANLFDVLGVRPAHGRAFLPEEDVAGGPRVAVLSHASWLRRFGGDPDAIGKTIVVGGRGAKVVGVLPPSVNYPDSSCEIWLPAGQNAAARKWRLLSIVGRFTDGVREPEARAELAIASRRLEAAFPDVNAGVGLRLVGLHQELTNQARPTLLLLLWAVGLVLLIACANVANLILARSLSRSGEMAVRSALGASRWRLVRQLLTEGVILAIAGGAVGALVGHWGVQLAMKRTPLPWLSHHQVTLDATVFGFALGISVLTGVLFSLAPAWSLLRMSPQHALRTQGRGATGAPGQRRLSSVLVIGEIALSLVLLAGAGLLLRTVANLLAIDPGYVTKNLLTMQVHLPPAGGDAMKLLSLNRQLEERLRLLPGVIAVGQISRLPLDARQNVMMALEIQGRPVARGQAPSIDVRYTTTDYYKTLSIPVSKGRPPSRCGQASDGVNG